MKIKGILQVSALFVFVITLATILFNIQKEASLPLYLWIIGLLLFFSCIFIAWYFLERFFFPKPRDSHKKIRQKMFSPYMKWMNPGRRVTALGKKEIWLKKNAAVLGKKVGF